MPGLGACWQLKTGGAARLRPVVKPPYEMSPMRAAMAVGSLGMGSLFLYQFAMALRPLVLPTLRQLGQEPTTYLVLRIAGVSFSGWQILLIEAMLVLAGLGLIFFAAYVFKSAKPSG